MIKHFATICCLVFSIFFIGGRPQGYVGQCFMQLANPPTVFAQADDDSEEKPALDVFDAPSSESFKTLNPLNMYDSEYKDNFVSPAGILNRALLFAFPLAGLILFVMLIWGGFEMVYGASSKKNMDQARQRITAALTGFGLLYASFWIIQIAEFVFNIAIL